MKLLRIPLDYPEIAFALCLWVGLACLGFAVYLWIMERVSR